MKCYTDDTDSKWGEQASGWGGEELVQSISRQLLGGGKEGKGWKRHALCTYTVVLTQIPASFSRSRSRVFNVELQADIVQHTELVSMVFPRPLTQHPYPGNDRGQTLLTMAIQLLLDPLGTSRHARAGDLPPRLLDRSRSQPVTLRGSLV